MKKTCFIILLILGVQHAFSQKQKHTVNPPDMPMDSITRLITFSDVVSLPGTTSEILYQRAWDWAHKYYKNPADVIREYSKDEGMILIKARYKIFNEPDKKGVRTDAGDVMYSLQLRFRDGRYKYEISKFIWQKLSAYPAERWMDTSSPSYINAYAGYLRQTQEQANILINALEESLGKTEVKIKDDW